MKTNRNQQKDQTGRNALGLSLLGLGNTILNTMAKSLVQPMHAAYGLIAGQAGDFGKPAFSYPAYRSESVIERSYSCSVWFQRSTTASTGGAIPVTKGIP